MESQRTLAERVIIGGSVLTMPLIFFAQYILGLFIVLSHGAEFIIPYISAGMVLTYIQYSVCIIFYSDFYRKWIEMFYRGIMNLNPEERKKKEQQILWAISLNPCFPFMTRFYRFVIPIVEVGYFMFIIVYSFFWKKFLPIFEDGPTDLFYLNLTFFVLQWSLLAFPFTSMLLGLSIMLVLGLPLLIVDIVRFRNQQHQNRGINITRIIQTFVGATRFKKDLSVPIKIDQCIICLQNFQPNELLVSLKCHEAHIFHELCIQKWTETRQECPICRNHLYMIEIEEQLPNPEEVQAPISDQAAVGLENQEFPPQQIEIVVIDQVNEVASANIEQVREQAQSLSNDLNAQI